MLWLPESKGRPRPAQHAFVHANTLSGQGPEAVVKLLSFVN